MSIVFILPRVFPRLVMRHTRICIEDPKLFLPDVLKMLVLALSQIYTRVIHLWNSIDLDSARNGDSRPCQFSFLSRVVTR